MSSDLQPSEKIIVTGAALRFAEAIAPITRLDAEAPEEARAVAVRGAVYRVQRRLRPVASDSSETEIMIRVEALAVPKPEEELMAVLAELGGGSGPRGAELAGGAVRPAAGNAAHR
jgi:hypothetical protein